MDNKSAKIIHFPKGERTELFASKEDLALMEEFTQEMADKVQLIINLILEERNKKVKDREPGWDDMFWYED